VIDEERLQPYSRAGGAVRDLLSAFLLDRGIKGDVHGPRIKGTAEIEKKMDEVGRPFEEIYDTAGLRVIVHYLDEVYLVADFICACENLLKRGKDRTLHEALRPEEFDQKHYEDYIKNPRGPTAYRTLQIVVYVRTYFSGEPVTVPVEVQVRTYLMHAWEEKDWRMVYKPPAGIAIPPSLVGEFYYISKLLFRVDEDFIEMRDRIKRIEEQSK